MATPASVLAEEPPLTWSMTSLKTPVPNRLATALPPGVVASSGTLGRVTEAVRRVGASLTGVTTVFSVTALAALE